MRKGLWIYVSCDSFLNVLYFELDDGGYMITFNFSNKQYDKTFFEIGIFQVWKQFCLLRCYPAMSLNIIPKKTGNCYLVFWRF